MFTWSTVIGVVALIFSLVCFYLFFKDATKPPPAPEKVVAQVRTELAAIDLDKLGAFAKVLTDAFAKLGTGLSALLGAVLFLLLSGEALGVYHLTGGTCDKKTECAQTDNGSPQGNSNNTGASKTTGAFGNTSHS